MTRALRQLTDEELSDCASRYYETQVDPRRAIEKFCAVNGLALGEPAPAGEARGESELRDQAFREIMGDPSMRAAENAGEYDEWLFRKAWDAAKRAFNIAGDAE